MTDNTASTIDSTVWNGSKGKQQITEMQTNHLQNSIAKLKTEISAGKTKLSELLSNMEAELSTRTDTPESSSVQS